MLLPMVLGAARGDAPTALYHRFRLDEPLEWVSIELQPTATVWHWRAVGGATARVDDVRSLLGSLKSLTIGVRCPGRTEGPVHYPCTFDIDVRDHDATGDSIDGWASTTARKLLQPGEGVVSALSTPRPEPGPIAPAGESGLLALVAPAALQAQFAQDRPLRLRVRVRHAPVPDDGTSTGAIGKAQGPSGPTHGVLVISTQPLRPPPAVPARDGLHKV